MKQQVKWGVTAAILALALSGSQVHAKNAPAANGARPAKHQMDGDALLKKLTGQLKLTQDEQDKIKPILSDEATQINAANADAALSKDQKKEKTGAARKAAADQITPLLTAEQQKKFSAHATKEKKTPKPTTGAAPTGTTQAN